MQDDKVAQGALEKNEKLVEPMTEEIAEANSIVNDTVTNKKKSWFDRLVQRKNKERKLHAGEKGHLNQLHVGQIGRVDDLHNDNVALRRRLLDMGITRGVNIKIKKIAPMGDPIDVELRGYELCVRVSDMKNIDIEVIK